MPEEEPETSGKRSSLRIALVCHRHSLGGHQGHVYHALARRFILTQVVVEENGWPQRLSDLPEGGEFDALLWRARFRELRHRPPFNRQAYSRPRIMLDHDTYRNYPDLWPESWNSDFHGAWPPVIRRQGFDLVLVSGKRVCALLRDDGVPAVWMPTAYAADWLFDTGVDRQRIGYYGALYPARRAMLRHLDRSSVAVRRFQCTASDLNDQLNRCLGAIICNMGGPIESRIGDEPNQPYPNEFTFAPEAMLKNFEVDQLREIGRRAADLVRARHTWDHRVAFLEKLLHSPDPASVELSWDLATSRIQEEDP
jgi:hypothetical protein